MLTTTPAPSKASTLQSGLLLTAGIILLIAAFLKSVSSDPIYLPFENPLLQNDNLGSFLIGWEAFLGIWLISGEFPRIFGLIGSINFILFAIVAASLMWIGEPDCQCFGSVATNLWLVLTLDCSLASGLIFVTLQKSRSVQKKILYYVAICALAVAISIFCVSELTSRLKSLVLNEAFRIDDTKIDLGDVRAGSVVTRDIVVTNISDAPKRLVGGTRDCSCKVTGNSTVVESGQKATIRIDIRVPASAVAGRYNRPVEVYTDDSVQPILRLRVGCRVR